MNAITGTLNHMMRQLDNYTDGSASKMPENRMLDPDYNSVTPESPVYQCDICGEGIYDGDRYAAPQDGAYFCVECTERLLMRVA